MPYKDPKGQQKWMKRRIKDGYGRGIYLQRKQRYENEKTLRAGVTRAVELITATDEAMTKTEILMCLLEVADVLTDALIESPSPLTPSQYLERM